MNNIFDYLNIPFIITNIICTYLIIKGIDYINGTAKVSFWIKRLVLIITIIVVSIIYIILDKDINKLQLFNSAIATPVAWSWIIKPIFTKLGIDYRKIDETII